MSLNWDDRDASSRRRPFALIGLLAAVLLAACGSNTPTEARPGPATQLAFTGQPTSPSAGAPIAPAIQATALDARGNTATGFTGMVTLAFGTNPGGGSLSGTASVAAVNGVTRFTNLSVDKVGTGYTLTASATGLTGTTSAAFTVTPGAATRLAFVVQPSDTAADAALSPAVQVTALDAQGNTATGFSGGVTVALGANPGDAGLYGATTVAAVSGVARFQSLSVNRIGTGYTLAASAPGLTGASSGPFAIVSSAFQHVFIVVEENTNYDTVIGDTLMPYLQGLAQQYGLATQYYANTHPSIGNYFMITVGDTMTNNDADSTIVNTDNVVRQLLLAHKTWKSYAEDLPYVGYTGRGTGKYSRYHNILTLVSDVKYDPVQQQNVVPFTQFATDLAAGALPNYAMIVPNLCNDAHDCPLATADAWLETNIAPLIESAAFQRDGLLIILFDESGRDKTNGGGRVAWVAVSGKGKRAYQSTTLYQHQSTLRLSLNALGVTAFPNRAATAPDMDEFFTP